MMKLLTILLTFITLTLAIKNECTRYHKITNCFKKCGYRLEKKFRQRYHCLSELHNLEDRRACYCRLNDRFFEQLSDCRNTCSRGHLYPEFTPSKIKSTNCYGSSESLGYKSSVSSLRATATEPGEYLLSGTYDLGHPWYACYTVHASDLTTRGTVTTDSSKGLDSGNDAKNSSKENKAAKGAQILSISLISLMAIALL